MGGDVSSLLDILREYAKPPDREKSEVREISPQIIGDIGVSGGVQTAKNGELTPGEPLAEQTGGLISQEVHSIEERRTQIQSSFCLVNSHNSLISPSSTVLSDDHSQRDGVKSTAFGCTLTASDWRDLYQERAAIREHDGGYPRPEAERLAWSELEMRWHMQHGERVPRELCAGCRRSIGIARALDLIDGCRVHFTDNDCLIRHGNRWRSAATSALLALGLP
jgi:hypothetical protein